MDVPATYLATSRDRSDRARELSAAAYDRAGRRADWPRLANRTVRLLDRFSEAPELAKLRGSAFGTASVMVDAAALRKTKHGRARARATAR